MNVEKMSAERLRIGDRIVIARRGKRGRWTAEFCAAGQHRRQSLKTSNVKVARQRAIEIEHELAAGDYRPTPPAISITEARKQYLSCLETDGRARKTLVRYRGELEAFGDFAAGRHATRLSQVTAGLFDGFRAHRRKDHATTTLYHEAVVVKQFMKWSVSRGLLQQNPLGDYKLTKPQRIKKAAPTLGDVEKILAQCTSTLRTRITVLACTGMRVGELQGLRKVDIDLRAGFISVAGQVGGPTKTRSSVRRIPIHRRIDPFLRIQLAADEHELLFTSQPSGRYAKGGHHINPKRLNDDFKAAAKKAGYANFTLHSLRRFFNTFAINSGVPERVVRLWMGHSDGSMTGVYYDLTDEESQRFMDSLSFEAAPATNPAAR